MILLPVAIRVAGDGGEGDGRLCCGTSSQPQIRSLKHADLVASVIARRSDDRQRHRAPVLKADPAAKYGMVVAVLDSIGRMGRP